MNAPAAKPRRWGLIIPWAIAALLVLGWCGYWFALRAGAANALAQWSQAQAQATGQEGYSAVAFSGFPLRLEARLTDAALVDPRGGYEVTTPMALVAINPVNPQHVILTLPQPVTYRLQGGAPRLMTGSAPQASLRLEGERLARLSFVGEGLQFAPPGAGPEEGLRFSTLAVHVRPDARNDADWQVAVQGAGVSLSAPVRGFESLGQGLDTLNLGVVFTKAEALTSADAPDPLALWRQAGGEARIEAAEIAWGPAQATAQGAVRLDAQARLEGTLDVRLEDARAFLAAIAGGGDDPFTSLLAGALDISVVTLTAQGGTLFWQAETPLGAIAPQEVRTLGPVYEAPSAP